MDKKEIKSLYEKIRDNSFSMRRGMSNSVAHGPLVERMKNILYNNLPEIEEALKFAADAAQQIEVLEVELADAERELDEATKKTTQKKTKVTTKDTDE